LFAHLHLIISIQYLKYCQKNFVPIFAVVLSQRTEKACEEFISTARF